MLPKGNPHLTGKAANVLQVCEHRTCTSFWRGLSPSDGHHLSALASAQDQAGTVPVSALTGSVQDELRTVHRVHHQSAFFPIKSTEVFGSISLLHQACLAHGVQQEKQHQGPETRQQLYLDKAQPPPRAAWEQYPGSSSIPSH